MPTSQPYTVQEEDNPRKRWWAYFGANSLALSILIHVLFGVGATYLIVQHFQKKHIQFKAAEPPAPHQVEHKVQMAKRNNLESAPPDLKRIVSTDVSAITLPEPPDLPNPDVATPSPMAGVDGTLGVGMGSGGGGGGGGNGDGGGGNPIYGATDGNGLEGTFYDLKQTPDEKPNEIGNSGGKAEAVMKKFIQTWNEEDLRRFFQAPDKLYAKQFCVPITPSEQAPAAYGVGNKVQGKRWIVVYHARVVPPETGKFRFVGFGDDYLVVRINQKNVFDGCYHKGQLDRTAVVDDQVGESQHKGEPLHAGQWFDLEEGTPVGMNVLIGEAAGGVSTFLLMIQKEGDDSRLGEYPVFQVVESPIPSLSPTYRGTKKKMIFPLAP